MRNPKSRLALLGVLTLVAALMVGLMSGSVADAKKKKKAKRSFTVTKSAPTVVPGGPPGPGFVVAKIPIGSVGKKAAKGKVIALNGVNVTTTFSGSPGFASDVVDVELIGPSGRNSFVRNPFGDGSNSETVSGPVTETPNSAADVCIPDNPPPPPPCSDPDATLGPPYVGTITNQGLLNFIGSKPIGTWFLKVTNAGTDPVTVGVVKVTGGLITKPQ
jgi:hypothetical protein